MKTNLFKDILKNKMKDGNIIFSQGRVYLFVFVISYLACLSFYMFKPNNGSMQTIIDALQWAILVFVTYVFGGKGVTATQEIFKIKSGKDIIPAVKDIASDAASTTSADASSAVDTTDTTSSADASDGPPSTSN